MQTTDDKGCICFGNFSLLAGTDRTGQDLESVLAAGSKAP